MISGPVFGSVALPVKRFPTRPWPEIQSDEGEDGAGEQEDAGSAGDEWAEANDDGDEGQDPRRLGARGREQVAEVGQEVGVPTGLPVRHADDSALDGGGGAVVGEQEQDGGDRPVAGPHDERRDGAADALGGRRCGDAGGAVAPIGRVTAGRAGPGHEADEPVDQYRAGRASQRGGGAGQEHAQAFAEEPDPRSPRRRRRPGRARRCAGTAGRRRCRAGSAAKNMFQTATSGEVGNARCG